VARVADLGVTAQRRTAGNGRGAAMASSIRSDRTRQILTSAIQNVIERACRTVFAPILISRSCRGVVDQWLTALGKIRARIVHL
jgi:hypothetical protein